MKTTKKAKQFLLTVLILSFITPLLYIIIYHQVGNSTVLIDKYYKPFILQHTKGSRIIIDSGSNSLYALDTYMIEKEFHIQTINLSDAAAYPLEQKLLRIEKYLTKDDIILLPLEWKYYSRIQLGDFFKNNLLGKLNYYYNFNSNLDEFTQILNTPFPNFIKNIKYRLLYNQYEYLGRNIEKFNNNERGTRINNRNFNSELTMSCDKYLFLKQLKNGYELSDTFKKNIQIIKRLQTKSKQIIFTWPTVANDTCYSAEYRPKIDKFVIKIKKYLADNEIEIIGNPYESKFPTKDMADTYYHVKPNVKEIRTKQLINSIKQHSVKKYFSEDKLQYQTNIQLSKNNMLNLLDEDCLVKEKISFKSSKVIFQGWSHSEKEFRWSLNNEAKIHFRINPRKLIGNLKLNINTLGKQNIKVTINGDDLGEKIVNGYNKQINFNFDKTILNKDKINTMKLEFSNAHRPNDKDNRLLAMALKSFTFE